tara:strand:+ start:134 stop:2440 length:2307 start_codon:yes stop_codon:yes gene_type:complete
MATPSVLTVPSMYGDGILYSGPTVYSSELVTNGNFQTDTDWTKTNAVISGGVATITVTGGGFSQIFQSVTYTSGKKYKLTASIKGASGSSGKQIRFQDNGSNTGGLTSVNGLVTLDETPQEIQIFWTANANSSQIVVARNTTSGDYQFTVDNLSIKEITQGSDFEFTRSTTGTIINEDGYIEDVPYNLVTNSETFSNWSKTNTTLTVKNVVAPSQSFTGCLLQGNTVNNRHNVARTGISDTQTVTLSVFVKKKELRYVQIASANTNGQYANFDVQDGVIGNVGGAFSNAKIESAGNEWYRLSVVSPNQYNSFYISLISGLTSPWLENWAMPNNTDGLYIWGAQIVKGDQSKNYLPTTDRLNLPRLNYPVYGGCPSILAEPQRTNLVINSNNAGSASGNFTSNIQINSSNNLSPEGINNAQEIEVTGGGQPRVESVVTSNTTVYSVSAYVKKVTGDFFGLGFYQADIGNQFAKFDLNTGTFVAVSSNGAVSQSATNIYNCEIIAYKNNWYRITCSILTGSSATKSNIKWLAMKSGTSASSFSNGNVGDKFLIYGRQVEQAGYVTSLMHTKGSTVTRNEDKAINSGLGTTDTFNDSEGVLFIETKALVNNAVARAIGINAGNGQNRVIISYPNTASSRIVGFIQTTAGSGLNGNVDGIDITQKHKIAVKYKLNNCAVFVDGVKRIQNNSVAMPVGLDRMHFSNGVNANSGEYRGDLNAIAVYKTALTDTELTNLTSYNNHDLFIPYRSRMQMIGADQELQCTEHDITRFL